MLKLCWSMTFVDFCYQRFQLILLCFWDPAILFPDQVLALLLLKSWCKWVLQGHRFTADLVQLQFLNIAHVISCYHISFKHTKTSTEINLKQFQSEKSMQTMSKQLENHCIRSGQFGVGLPQRTAPRGGPAGTLGVGCCDPRQEVWHWAGSRCCLTGKRVLLPVKWCELSQIIAHSWCDHDWPRLAPLDVRFIVHAARAQSVKKEVGFVGLVTNLVANLVTNRCKSHHSQGWCAGPLHAAGTDFREAAGDHKAQSPRSWVLRETSRNVTHKS